MAVATAAVVLLNVLGVFFFGRADFTDARLFSLSDGSKRTVQQLEERLEVTAYFTENLPPPFNATERYVRDHGVFQNTSVVHPTVPTFVQALKASGYHTAQTG